MSKKTQQLDEEIINKLSTHYYQSATLECLDDCDQLAKKILFESLQKKEQQMLQLFKGWLPKKLKRQNPLGQTNEFDLIVEGFNDCLDRLKQKATEDGFII